MPPALDKYIRLMLEVFPTVEPRLLIQAKAVNEVLTGRSLESVARAASIQKHRLKLWVSAIEANGLYYWLDKQEPTQERFKRARQGIAQMLLGTLAEDHFKATAGSILGDQGYRTEDQRVGRTDTDFRLIGPERRAICRLNIKFHGTLFRESVDYVGVSTDDCFALATYKIHGALRRQEEERLPYIFVILSAPQVPRVSIENSISDDWVWLAAISDRATEEAIVERLRNEAWVAPIQDQIRASEFKVLSARRAYNLLRDHLFDRVHALRLRGFTRTFRNAEIDMHLSLQNEMTPFADFLGLLADRGPLELALRLDRGEI